MKQLQRLGAMTQSLERMTQTMGGDEPDPRALCPACPSLQTDEDAPRQQPQQQQQTGSGRYAAGLRSDA